MKYVADRLNLQHRWRLSGQRLGIAATMLAVIMLLFLLPRNYRFPKQDFRGARDFVESQRSPADSVATTGLASSSFEKYFASHWKTIRPRQELEVLRRGYGNTWLVNSFPAHTASAHPDIVDFMETDFELPKPFPGTLDKGAVKVYRSRADHKQNDSGRVTCHEMCTWWRVARVFRTIFYT